MRSLFNVLILNVFIFSLAAVAFSFDLIQSFFLNDITHVSWFIAALMCLNVLLTIYVAYHKGEWHWDDTSVSRYLQWIVGKFFYFGIAGTFFAMIYLFSHIDLSKVTDVDSIRLLLKEVLTGLIGIGTTSLAGIMAYLWSSVNNFILFGE